MKIGIIGDTHGSKKVMETICRHFEGAEFFLHTGDHWKDAFYLEDRLQVPVLTVRGNCDLSEFCKELTFEVMGQTFLLTHGHEYKVKYGLERLYYRALELNAGYCVFGHTHVPFNRRLGGTLFLNPGSLAWPRGRERYAGILLEHRSGAFRAEFVEAGFR